MPARGGRQRPGQHGAGHHRVAGEELGAGDHHEAQPGGEDKPGDDLPEAMGQALGPGQRNRGEQAAKADEEPRQHAEHQHRPYRERRLVLERREDGLLQLRR